MIRYKLLLSIILLFSPLYLAAYGEREIYQVTYPMNKGGFYVVNLATGFNTLIMLPKGVKVISQFSNEVKSLNATTTVNCSGDDCSSYNQEIIILNPITSEVNNDVYSITTNRGLMQFYLVNTAEVNDDSVRYMQKVILSDTAENTTIVKQTLIQPSIDDTAIQNLEIDISSNSKSDSRPETEEAVSPFFKGNEPVVIPTISSKPNEAIKHNTQATAQNQD